MSMADMDLVEINEAFAVQVIESARQLGSIPSGSTCTAGPSRSGIRSGRPGPGS